MQAVRPRVHARATSRRIDGVLRGRVRGVLRSHAPARRPRKQWTRSRARYDRVRVMAARTVESTLTAAAPGVQFHDPQIEMAHGAGGKATRRLVEGLLVPLLLPVNHGTRGQL